MIPFINQAYYDTLLKLYRLFDSKKGLEIGTGWGTSAQAYLNTFDKAKLVSVDQDNYHHVFEPLADMYGDRIEIRKIRTSNDIKSSDLASDQLYDYIYVDAAHDYLAVKNDIKLVLPLISMGGVIAFDDYCLSGKTEEGLEHGVKKAVDELINFPKIFYKRHIIAFRKE